MPQVAAVAVDRMMIGRATLTRVPIRLLTSLRLLQVTAKIHTRSVSLPHSMWNPMPNIC